MQAIRKEYPSRLQADQDRIGEIRMPFNELFTQSLQNDLELGRGDDEATIHIQASESAKIASKCAFVTGITDNLLCLTRIRSSKKGSAFNSFKPTAFLKAL